MESIIHNVHIFIHNVHILVNDSSNPCFEMMTYYGLIHPWHVIFNVDVRYN
jgi:hypothetical protein